MHPLALTPTKYHNFFFFFLAQISSMKISYLILPSHHFLYKTDNRTSETVSITNFEQVNSNWNPKIAF